MTRFRVAWQSKLTAFRQHGDAVPYGVARDWATVMDAKWGDVLTHWVSVENGWPQ